MATTLTTGRVTVGTTATLIVAALGTRTRLRLTPLDQGILYIGKDNTVTPANGYNVCGNVPTAQGQAELDTLTGDVWGIVKSGSMDVAFLEVG